MTFLKLSNVLVNTRLISHVDISASKYSINFIRNIDGGIFGNALFMWGGLHTPKPLEVLEKDDHDFKVVSDWIDKQK
jgi:hypothetical protein